METQKKYGWGAKPGEKRNPKGRPPKEHCIPDILREIGKEQIKYKVFRDSNDTLGMVESASRMKRMCKAIWEKADKADPWACEFIAERTEGKVTQQIRAQIEDYRVSIDDNS